MKYENKKFSIAVGENKAYGEGWDRIFGAKKKKPAHEPEDKDIPDSEKR